MAEQQDVPFRTNNSHTEAEEIRSLLQLPPGSSTDDVLMMIQMLQYQNGQLSQVWQTLTELLYLSTDTPPADVLTTIAIYIKEAQYLKEQEQRHLYIIQKLQNDKREILKRFHLNKPKVPAMTKIREKARFPSKKVTDNEDLGIIEDEQESLAESFDDRQRQVRTDMEAMMGDKHINGDLWKLLDDSKPTVNGDVGTSNGDVGTSSMDDTGKDSRQSKPYIQGFILAKSKHKISKESLDFRNNVTQGTKESENKKISNPDKDSQTSNPSNAARHQKVLAHKPPRSSYKHKMEKIQNTKSGFVLQSELHVPECGGCYDVPDLGLTVSIPGGALPEGSSSEKIIIGLAWGDTGLDIQPVGPILTIKPAGLPFRKPLAVSLQHNSCTAEINHMEDIANIQSTNLILMQKQEGRDIWQAVEPDPGDPFFTPLGFTAASSNIMFLRTAGRYALVASQASRLYVPADVCLLVFVRHTVSDGHTTVQLEIYCLEDNTANCKLKEVLIDTFKQEMPPKHMIVSHQMSLSGLTHISASLCDIMEGWCIHGNQTQTVQLGSQCQCHKPIMSFTLSNTVSHLGCLLAKLNFVKSDGQPTGQSSKKKTTAADTVTLCIDLDQLEQSGSGTLPQNLLTASFSSTASNKTAEKQPAAFSPQKSGTFITDYFEDTAGQKYSKEQQVDTRIKVLNSATLKVKVAAEKNYHSWIPQWVKTDLISEVKSEMSSADKWDKLLAGLDMSFLDQILHQSVDPVTDFFSYCEVTGVSVSKVKDILGTTGFEDSSNILSKYLNVHHK